MRADILRERHDENNSRFFEILRTRLRIISRHADINNFTHSITL